MSLKNFFKQNNDGSWEPKQLVTISGPSGAIQMGPGMKFRKGVQFLGIDVVEQIERGF